MSNNLPAISETLTSTSIETNGWHELSPAGISGITTKTVAMHTSEAINKTGQIDRVQLSDSVAQAIENSKFNATRVEALRLAIMEGLYPLDAKLIAENMFSLEQMVS